MYKKTVTYEDFNGVSVTEDLYFNLSRSDMIKLVKEDPGFSDRMQKAFNNGDSTSVFSDICDLIVRSYGIKSDDGKKFSKKVDGELLSDSFPDTAAYEALLTVILAGGEEELSAIMTGLFPADLWAEAQAEMAKNENLLELPGNDSEIPVEVPVEPVAVPVEVPVEPVVATEIATATQELTDEQLQTMTTDEIVAYYKAKGL